MKISNFRDYVERGKGLKVVCLADIDVESGILWWKKKRTRAIFKGKYDLFWAFLDTGEFTPGRRAEQLEKVYLAKCEMEVVK